jgi:tRNA (guanine-N(7)-)-methyltransferase subunit TRM82
MPKRPCSIAVFQNRTIIIADKFGDVHSLPLIAPSVPVAEPSAAPTSEPKTFTPAADVLTVHSARNRKALESQLKQKVVSNAKSDIVHPGQKVELGHVSMLTKVLLAEWEDRAYILTADRDEHIRVSRGIPQAHVVERFCQGHQNFVTELCIPDVARNLLISGGGDEELYVWDWTKGQLVDKVSLREHVDGVLKDFTAEPVRSEFEAGKAKIVVSGIVASGEMVAVACEACVFPLNSLVPRLSNRY